jgi:hypothetical protein
MLSEVFLIALPALVRELGRARDGHQTLAALLKILQSFPGLFAGFVDAGRARDDQQECLMVVVVVLSLKKETKGLRRVEGLTCRS